MEEPKEDEPPPHVAVVAGAERGAAHMPRNISNVFEPW